MLLRSVFADIFLKWYDSNTACIVFCWRGTHFQTALLYLRAEKQNLIEIRLWQRTPNLHHMLSAVKHYCYLNQNFFLPPSLMVSFYHDIQMAPPICCMWAKHIVPNRVLTHKISTKWEIFIFMARKCYKAFPMKSHSFP